MKKKLLRLIICLLGLSGFGVIVAEILKKWQLVSKDLGLIWFIAPILILFVCREVTSSSYIKENQKFSPQFVNIFAIVVKVIFIIITVIICISIPFIWFGTIEELAGRG
ncbi:MAG: hypothetical protein KJO26_12625 [Deltaproteobacteria bacterium]|nr:hypothetical protein [Deltaproteobacteria bacterium]